MSVEYAAGLAVTLVAVILCGVLLLLCAWLQVHNRQLAPQQQKKFPHKLGEKFHTHINPGKLQRSEGFRSTATVTHPSNSRCAAQTTADQDTARNAFHVGRDAAAPATLQLVRLGNCRRSDAVFESSLDCGSPSRWQRESTGTFSSELDCAWPRPLVITRNNQQDPLKQQVWRNSSGGSSYYSRPSSWYSAANTGELEDTGLSRVCRAGPGPTVWIDQSAIFRYKALPPIPTQEEERCAGDATAHFGELAPQN
ncbi:hypothetical protein J1614_011085 [Plenodomus biglobosus]|nr:hypothetical protein J1614_011085 [Plenodomus biglobosus]